MSNWKDWTCIPVGALALLVGFCLGLSDVPVSERVERQRVAPYAERVILVCDCGWDAPLLPELDDSEFSAVAYDCILGREPDPFGMDANQWPSRWAFVGTLMASEEFQVRRLPKLQSKERR